MSKSFFRNRNGQGIIELALTLPLLFLLGFGIFEFGRAIYTKNVIINMSREGANIYSRDPITSPQSIMDALAATASPLDMNTFGMMYLNTVEGTVDGPVIREQAAWDNAPAGFIPSSKVGTPTAGNPQPAANLTDLALLEGEIAYIVEVFYDFDVIFSGIINYQPEIYAQSAF